MARIYRDEDIDLGVLEGEKIAIIGYGSQGRAQALNMRDSGLDVVVGVRKGGRSWELASRDGMEVREIPEAARLGDIVHMLVPDEVQPDVYEKYIKDNLQEGNALCFSHGFNIRFKQIIPPEYVDVIMVAPKGPGAMVRKLYEEGFGVPALIAVEQDYTGRAKERVLALAKAIGAGRAGIIETTFAEETETDLFGEQVDLCGGVTELILAAFEILVEAGYQPEVAYFETLHELKLIVDLIYQKGLYGMWQSVSNTAKYGGLTRRKRIINELSRREMKKILEEIRSGEFAREWILENKANRPVLRSLMEQEKEHLIEKVGRELRKMMKLE